MWYNTLDESLETFNGFLTIYSQCLSLTLLRPAAREYALCTKEMPTFEFLLYVEPCNTLFDREGVCCIDGESVTSS